MSGTITFGGVGSGIDTESIVSGLVSANSEKLNSLQARSKSTGTALTALSDVSRYLTTLRTAALALDTAREASAYQASSSSTAVVTSISGSAMPGSFSVEVKALASEQRTYSRTFAENTGALGQTGTIGFQVGSGTEFSIDVEATDSLSAIASKINALGERVSASVFYDGTSYRLQVRGLDTGSANALTFTETGVDFDLNGDGTDPAGGKTTQLAANSELLVDGFTVTSATNQVVGAIPGITLAVTAKTTEAATVTVVPNADTAKTNLRSVVNAFNTVVSTVHSAAGFGTIKATNDVLKGDSALRSVTSRLSDAFTARGTSGGTFELLSQIGVSLNRDGTVALDDTKLAAAVAKDTDGVSALIAEKMTSIADLIKAMQTADSGTLALRQSALEASQKRLDDDATREQDRLTRYAETLRKQFTNMDSSVAASNALMTQLTALYG